MRNLLFLAVLFFGLSSCSKDMVELDVQSESNQEEENLSEGLDTRGTWPMGAYDLVDFMNANNYTNSRYVGCNEDLKSVSFSGGNSTEVTDPYGPLSCRPHEELYSINDYGAIMHTLFDKVKAECDGDAVIVDVEFRVGFFYNPDGNYNYYIDAFPTICCDPILEEVQIPDPTSLSGQMR